MAVVTLYKNRYGNVAVVKGKHTFNFNSGRYWPRNEAEDAILKELAARRGQGVYIDPNESEIDTSAATPMEVLKRKIISEYLASQKEVKDAGNYQAGQLNPANTASSTIMNNSLAEQVADKAVEDKDDKPEEPASPALASALERLKGAGNN